MKPAHWLIALLAAAGETRAQSGGLDARIAAVREGTVRLAFAPRPGVCGDGADIVRDGRATYGLSGGMRYGRSEFVVCRVGPVRVSVGRADGETVSLRVHVGGPWGATDGATDLGTVSAEEAARYFLRQATTLAGRNGEYALAAAALADSATIWPDLVRLIRSAEIRSATRQQAVFWLAGEGAEGERAIRDLIRDTSLSDEIRASSIIALGRDDVTDENASFLRDLYPSLSNKLKDDVFLVVSRSDSRAVTAWLASIIANPAEGMEVRKQALFWAGQGRTPIGDLVGLYDRVPERELREHFTFVLSQRHDAEAVRKLIDIAQREPDRGVRRQAFFWLGQSNEPSAREFLRDMVTR